MRAIYLDESATTTGDRYYFGALVVDADAARRIETGLHDVCALVARHTPGFNIDAELHGVDVFHGKKEWRTVLPAWRVKACELTVKCIRDSGAKLVFRGVDVAALRRKYRSPHPPHELVLAQILEDVDGRLGPGRQLGQLGICHADEHHTAASSRRNLRAFKTTQVKGYTTRPIRNIVDTIYFGPSDASRLLQAADVATFFHNRNENVQTRDPRAQRAMRRIMTAMEPATLRAYTWVP